jgi:AraC family transcriptional regulator
MPASYEDRILRVLAYIHDNPASDLSLDQLADVAAMSRFHWHRVFRAMTGETCAQAVRRLRLHLAAVRLVQSDQPIAALAAGCGYPNAAAFARAFNDAYGCSPAAFRKSGRLLTPLAGQKPTEPAKFAVAIRVEPPRRLAALAHRGAYHTVGRSFDTLNTICESRGLWAQTGPMIAFYIDNPDVTTQADLRNYAAVEWRGTNIPDGLEEHSLTGGRTAVLTFQGHYSGLSIGYQALFGTWLPASGHEPADAPSYEIYLNSPRNTAPADLRTEICLLLK